MSPQKKTVSLAWNGLNPHPKKKKKKKKKKAGRAERANPRELGGNGGFLRVRKGQRQGGLVTEQTRTVEKQRGPNRGRKKKGKMAK